MTVILSSLCFLPIVIAAAATSSAAAASGVSSTDFFMPPGCTCQKTGAINNHQCDQFDCGCKCDLTAGVCDLNCCCDEECGDHSFFECSDEGASPPIVKMCVEGVSALEKTNLQFPFRISDSPEDKLHGLVCIDRDNSPVKGIFFEDEGGYPSASQVFSPGSQIAKPVGFHSNTNENDHSIHGTYQLGDKINSFALSDGVIVTDGHLTLPTKDDGGFCIDFNAARFGKSMTDNSCLRRIENLAEDCETKLNADRYITMYVESEKGSVTRDPNLLQVKMGNKQPASWDKTAKVCNNAIRSLTYYVIYNQTAILDVSIKVETINIEMGESTLKQEFAIQFIPIEAQNILDGSNDVLLTKRSGNPGYISGMPTLGATSLSLNETVSRVFAQNNGFTAMDTGVGGKCSNSSPTGSVVGFANDMFVGCTHSMTRGELQEFCTANSHPMLLSQTTGDGTFVYPRWLESKQDYLGIFGNADPLDIEQWIKIESLVDEPSFTTRSRSWIDSENRCIGMPSKLRVEILWTHVGNINNPQAKILR